MSVGARPAAARAVFALFALSGFAGIIYESIWSHYLKLFLGHAAYAQTLVLVMFMGGMAAGAWLASRISVRLYDLLKVYIAVEVLIGLGGLAFHDVYQAATGFAYHSVFPVIGHPLSVEVVKTLLGACLILPQSVLLGMTFPLMTVGLMQRAPRSAGRLIAGLYFVNSFGAAVGILASAFVFIAWLGLPGTIRLAGQINLFIAVALTFVMIAIRLPSRRSSASAARPGAGSPSRTAVALLLVALATGAASFIYEIVWIRLLSMVLGSSTHSFELMLSAFILGLALGSDWIRRRISSIRHPLAILGFIQLAMGTLALATLMFYDFSYALMSAALFTLAKTQLGYAAFALTSHAIALFIMLPVTICAGMTLPLITHALLEAKEGERSVGRVYASNTVGAIIGVVVAVHVLIPGLSLEGALIAGAAVDLVVGAALLARWLPRDERGALWPAVFAVTAFFTFTLLFVEVDPRKMAAGVYRTGVAEISDDARIALRRDGKTSTVTVMHIDESLRVLSTNGKPDASIEFDPEKERSRDESTQILTGLLPLMFHPDARSAALIGIGSGHSTHAILASPHLERVDTIEIEAAMIEGAKRFMPAVARAFDDPRSHLIVNDARTVFSTERHSYDVIISEPSNPWVSGVSGLFSVEFYELAARHLARDGVFAQWMQTYETNIGLVASVFKALSSVFGDFVVYAMDGGNLLILATRDGTLREHPSAVLDMPEAGPLLRRIDVSSPVDLLSRRVGDAHMLMPLLNSFPLPRNSDFHPVLDLGSATARYLDANARGLLSVAYDSVPLLDRFGVYAQPLDSLMVDTDYPVGSLSGMIAAAAIAQWLSDGTPLAAPHVPDDLRYLAGAVLDGVEDCGAGRERQTDLLRFVRAVFPYLPSARRIPIAARIAPAEACDAEDPAILFVNALARGDGGGLRAAASTLRARFADDTELGAYLVESEMFANLLDEAGSANLELWANLTPERRGHLIRRLPLRLMLAHSGWTAANP